MNADSSGADSGGRATAPTVLEEAASLINGDRQEQYGNATESFDRIADMWGAYLNTNMTGLDVVNLMVLLKVSRTRNTYHRDSYVDIAGYAGLGERLYDESADEVVGKFDLYVDQLKANQPRVWESIREIPVGVSVKDKDGTGWSAEFIRAQAPRLDLVRLTEQLDSRWGPWTEVLETT